MIYYLNTIRPSMKKCPKCGNVNDDDAIFCESCDWKLNLTFDKAMDAKFLMNSWLFAGGALLLGVTSLIGLLLGVSLMAVICGGIGMFLGGYSQAFARVTGVNDVNRKRIVIVAIVGLLLSVITFVYGFSTLF